MARRAGATVLRAVRSAVAVESTDQELLARFTAGDEAAFAALVNRHSALVLGVCRRALPTVQDAEDACQATFLVLARKAKATRWQPSIANWLYTTARRVASRVSRAATRRVQRESRPSTTAAPSPLDQMTGREAFVLLDEELDRLPAIYREPLVLCYLQGLTRDEAAARLRVPSATLKSQLDRGRKKLAHALTQRGVVMGAGLLALAATSRAGASPPRLGESILAAVAGRASPAVAALAEGAVMNSVVKKSVVAGLLIAGAVALGLGMVPVRPTAADEPPAKSPPTKPARDGKVAPSKGIVISGCVLGPEGKPPQGATLLHLSSEGKLVKLGRSGADGHFAVEIAADRKAGYLVAQADGLGIDFTDVAPLDPAKEIELRLVADVPVRGRLVDTEGKPVAGASVRAERLSAFADDSLDSLLKDWKGLLPHMASPAAPRTIWAGASALFATTTDKDGRFELQGIGAERLTVLRFSGAGVNQVEAYVASRPRLDPKPYNDAVRKNAGGSAPRWHLHGPEMQVVAEREKPIRGRVFDVATGKGRAGVHVILSRSGNDLLPIVVDGWTDKEGRYEIHGARKAVRYMVEVFGDEVNGYVPAQKWADDTPGYEPVTADVATKKGVIVTGKMIDKGTGKPVRGFVMIGVPQGNSFVKEYPELNNSAWFGGVNTAADGAFRVVTVPGPVLLMGGPNTLAEQQKYKRPAADPKYPKLFREFGDHTAYYMPGGAITPLQGNFCKVVELKPDAATAKHDIELEPVK